ILGVIIGNVTSTLLFDADFIIPWLWMMVAIATGIVVGLLSGYLPARKAARLDPVESLRFE
ncbi:MAG: ABC transporter permease, partial [Ekhidna sp.]|nr:ABC transporter permease [Ekhidna sp.]